MYKGDKMSKTQYSTAREYLDRAKELLYVGYAFQKSCGDDQSLRSGAAAACMTLRRLISQQGQIGISKDESKEMLSLDEKVKKIIGKSIFTVSRAPEKLYLLSPKKK